MAKLFACEHKEIHRLSSVWLNEISGKTTTVLQALYPGWEKLLQPICKSDGAKVPVGSQLQLQLGRELLLTYSLCRLCKSGSGMWKAYSTFQTCALDGSAT